jgi:hypothetical protein
VELPRFNSVHYFFFKHQVLDVTCRYHHALVSREAFSLADFKESFNLLVHAAYGLNLTFLVNRARYS